MPDAPAIYDALARITDELGFLEKSGRGPASQSSYPFLPVDNIVAKLNPLLTTHGVIVVPHESDAVQAIERFPKVNMDGQPVFDGRAPGAQIQTRVHCSFDFISVTDGSMVTASAFGEALDSGDKGLRKAGTAAYKVVLLRLFTIVSGDEDPDASHPGDEPALIAKQDRGEQQRNRAAAGKPERAPRAPRQPREKAAPAESVAQPERTEAAPADPAPAVPAEQPAVAADEAPVREQQTPAEQRSSDWKPDPEDVAAAEKMAPKAREPKAPVAKPAAETKTDQRYESVADVRKAIREGLETRGLDRTVANDIGDSVTGKPRGQWFANLTDLHTVLREIEGLPVPESDSEGAGF